MLFQNNTHRQHYVSQVEQRFNKYNGNDLKKPKIYKFKIEDREQYIISNEGLCNIENNLKFEHLFTYEENSNGLYSNFEKLYGIYEEKINIVTRRILQQKKNSTDLTEQDIIDFLKCKFMNVIRNPYGIKLCLEYFGKIADYSPVDDSLLSECVRIESCVPKEWGKIQKVFNVSLDNYRRWMKVNLLMLADLNESKFNFLASIFNKMMQDKNLEMMFLICKYDNNICFLSDLGYNVTDRKNMGFDFNVSKNVFCSIMFVPIDDIIQKYKINSFQNRIVKIHQEFFHKPNEIVLENNLKFLTIYNQRTISQCYENVFSAEQQVIGVHIIS